MQKRYDVDEFYDFDVKMFLELLPPAADPIFDSSGLFIICERGMLRLGSLLSLGLYSKITIYFQNFKQKFRRNVDKI